MMAPKVDVPNYNESIDQIDYKSLVLLGQKSTATTYVDRAALANEEEATIRILKPEETDKTARQLLLGLDGKTMTVFSFTMEEYVAMIAEQEGTLTYIPGDVRAGKRWLQTIGVPTIQDAANQLCWHVSKGHTTPSSSTVMVAIQLDLNNWCSHHTMKHVNSFQRGYSLQMRQVLEGFQNNLTAEELSTMVIVNYDNYNVLQLASRFVWSSGYVWASAMPVNVLTALEVKDDENNSHIMTALIQGLYNGGTTCLKIMPKHIRDKALEFLLDRNLATTPANMIPMHSIGHPDHAAWVMTRSDNEIQQVGNKENRKRRADDMEVEQKDG